MPPQGKELAIWLSDIPATAVQRRRSLVIMGLMAAAFVCAAYFGSIRLPGNNAFIPVVQTILFIGDLITAVLIYTKCSINGSRALLILASGYLFTALIIIPHTLTFPGVFAPDGVLGPALQTTGWLYVIWHLAFPLATIVYVVLRTNSQTKRQVSDESAIFWSVIIVIGLVCAITWGLLAAEDTLPRMFLDRTTFALLVPRSGLFTAVVCAIALALLWFRGKSILDQWLAIAIFAVLMEQLMVSFFLGRRFDMGWYAVRIFGVIAATAVLLALLAETMNLYAKLARSIQALKQERDVRFVTVEAATGAMAHEMRQPLSAIAASGEAGLAWLRRTPPDLKEVSECLTAIVQETHSANEVITSIRRLFNVSGVEQRSTLQVNDLIQETLSSLEHDLRDHGVSLITQFADTVPPIHADRAQIQQLLLNLFKNAIEAMLSCAPEKRSLRVATGATENSRVSIYIRDTGPGITAENRESIFDPFFTTKQNGTGLGLSICSAIVERHGGKLRLGESNDRGTTFEISFPA